MQQDAHEFLNYLLNTVSETLIEEKNAERDRLMRNGTLRKGTLSTDRGRDEASGFVQPFGKCSTTIIVISFRTSSKADTTWIHEIFQGTLTNETRCLCCETVSVAFYRYFRCLIIYCTRRLLAIRSFPQ